MPRYGSILAIFVAAQLLASPSGAATHSYEPVSDADDGQLINGATWDDGPNEATVEDLLLAVGQEGKNTYDASLSYTLADVAEGAMVDDVRIRLNQQGGVITSILPIEISAALTLDPLTSTGLLRFLLPRTVAKVTWNVSADWDSSGQRIAKWIETPDLSPIIEEVVAQSGWDTSTKAIALFLELDGAVGDNIVRFDDTHGPAFGNAGIRPGQLLVHENFRDAFWGKELLCRPKPTSIEVNIVPHANTEAFVQWGTDSLSFGSSTTTDFVAGGTAHEFLLSGLTEDTRYWYRLRYRPSGGGAFQTGPTRTFVTLPTTGEVRMCVTSDAHVTNSAALGLDEHLAQLESSLLYMEDFIAPERYHLWMDLGDLVVIRAQRIPFDLEETEQRYRRAREYVDLAGHSLPLVFVRGNHEEVNGWDDDATPDNTTIWSGSMLLKYLPPPLPDAFYEGNTAMFPNLGLPGNYFAFNAGNLRVRALDPYLHSTTRPHNGHGETGGSLDGWDWTLGDAQYDWLYDDLVQNPTPFCLVAMHHLTSCYTGSGEYYGRGGIEIAKYSVDSRPSFEWGGEDSTGADILGTKRPNFLHGAVHDMLAANDNQVLLKGHDHFHARQILDDMVYVTLAKPNDTGQQTGNLWGWRYSSFYPTAVTLFEQNSGFINIAVTDSVADYEYIQTYPLGGIGTILDAFSVLPAGPTDAPGPSLPAPRRTSIRKVSPNPSRTYARLEYEIAAKGAARIAIYDASGRLVREVLNEFRPTGLHSVVWDGRDRNGRRVVSGVYFAKLSTEKYRDAVKMVILH